MFATVAYFGTVAEYFIRVNFFYLLRERVAVAGVPFRGQMGKRIFTCRQAG